MRFPFTFIEVDTKKYTAKELRWGFRKLLYTRINWFENVIITRDFKQAGFNFITIPPNIPCPHPDSIMDTTNQKPTRIVNATLVYLLRGDPPGEILLGFKKVGFGIGKFVGYGGKIEPGETIPQAAVRELAEESGIQIAPTILTYVADIIFLFPNKPDWNHRVHAYTAPADDREPQETDEMKPHWFPLTSIPYNKMWDDSHYWLPRVLSGDKIKARFIFNHDNTTVDEVEFSPLGEPP